MIGKMRGNCGNINETLWKTYGLNEGNMKEKRCNDDGTMMER